MIFPFLFCFVTCIFMYLYFILLPFGGKEEGGGCLVVLSSNHLKPKCRCGFLVDKITHVSYNFDYSTQKFGEQLKRHSSDKFTVT